jgi:2-oxoglutarate ferredoxin oxidoreductase subunit gamma
MSKLKVLAAGHGGQGVLLLGDYIAYTAMLEGKHVAYTPSYGPETRGGKAKCYVIISDEHVDNPIAEEPDVELIMNQPSMDFLNSLRPEGLIIYNTSLIDTGVDRDDVKRFGIPATEIADGLRQEASSEKIQDPKMFTNAVMFGAFLEICAPQISEDRIKESLKHLLAGKKEGLISLNHLALAMGKEFVRSHPLPEHSATSPFHCVPSWASQ